MKYISNSQTEPTEIHSEATYTFDMLQVKTGMFLPRVKIELKENMTKGL